MRVSIATSTQYFAINLCAACDGKIESLNVVRQRDDAKWYQRATAVIGRILAKQDTKGVDVVSGATHSSRGIIDATTQALGKARTGAQP